MADALARTGSIFATGLAFYLFFIDTYLPFIVFGLMTQQNFFFQNQIF